MVLLMILLTKMGREREESGHALLSTVDDETNSCLAEACAVRLQVRCDSGNLKAEACSVSTDSIGEPTVPFLYRLQGACFRRIHSRYGTQYVHQI